eukprot:GHVP01025228.1.p1 GENE.GHVP01025228.1~~GHVP01025228.1.p1  ORF type:complete len:110 (+),score=16.49 GHVP01025228.1:218-547(+)
MLSRVVVARFRTFSCVAQIPTLLLEYSISFSREKKSNFALSTSGNNSASSSSSEHEGNIPNFLFLSSFCKKSNQRNEILCNRRKGIDTSFRNPKQSISDNDILKDIFPL